MHFDAYVLNLERGVLLTANWIMTLRHDQRRAWPALRQIYSHMRSSDGLRLIAYINIA